MTKRHISLLMAILMILGLAAVFAGCSAKDEGEFRVALECDYPPFNWTQSDNANGAVPIESGEFAGGYDIQIAKKVAEGLSKKLVIVKTAWDGLVPALTSGTVDAIIAGMSPTEDRKLLIDFSDNYYNSDLVVVVKKDGPYAAAKSINDFADAKITGQLSTFHYDVIDQMAGVKKQTAMADFPTMVVALTSGVIDGYISERPGAKSAVASNPSLTFVEFAEGSGFVASESDTAIAVGLQKGSPLKDRINEILAKITADERVQLMEDALNNQPVVAEE